MIWGCGISYPATTFRFMVIFAHVCRWLVFAFMVRHVLEVDDLSLEYDDENDEVNTGDCEDDENENSMEDGAIACIYSCKYGSVIILNTAE